MATTYNVTTTSTSATAMGTLAYALTRVAAGDTISFQIGGTFTVPSSSAIPNGGITLTASNGDVTLNGGSFTDPASGNGALTLAGSSAINLATTLSYSGTTTVSDTATLTGADTSSGQLAVTAGAALTIASTGSVAEPNPPSGFQTGSVINDGSITVTAGATFNSGVVRNQSDGYLSLSGPLPPIYNYGQLILSGSATIPQTGVIYQEGGSFDLGGQTLATMADLYIMGGSVSDGTLNGSSFMRLSAGTVFANLTGSGTADKYGSGTVTLFGNDSYTGGTTLSGAGLLELASATAAGSGSITFMQNSTATLAIDDISLGPDANATFGNTIAGFAAGQALLFNGIANGAVSFNYGTDTLTVTTSGKTAATVHLSGNFAGEVFSATPGSNGQGTTVTVSASKGPTVSITGVSGATTLVDHVVTGTVDVADAGSKVTVMNGSTALGTATSDANGNWSLPFVYTGDGTSFAYSLTATDTNAAGTGTSAATGLALNFAPNQSSFGTVSHDTNHPGGEVYALYEGLLGRAPDALGEEYYVNAINSGTPVSAIAASFINSPEGQTRFPTSENNSTFVEQLYEDVLGRKGDSNGVQYYTNQLNNNRSRADVADNFVFSAEYQQDLQPALQPGVFAADSNTSMVARLYYGLLGRAPDAGGLQGNTQALSNGTSITGLAQNFLNSGEYQTQYRGLNNSDFVNDLYQNALGRPASSGDSQYWTNQLTNGKSRASVAVAISESTEGQNHLLGRIENGFHLA